MSNLGPNSLDGNKHARKYFDTTALLFFSVNFLVSNLSSIVSLRCANW